MDYQPGQLYWVCLSKKHHLGKQWEPARFVHSGQWQVLGKAGFVLTKDLYRIGGVVVLSLVEE